ncbi:hypothetical protein PC116_g31391, partial [Phytophthora cactorum]
MPSTSIKYDDKLHSRGGADGEATGGTERKNSRDDNGKGTKAYPFIVSPPASTAGKDKGKDTGSGTSPAAT